MVYNIYLYKYDCTHLFVLFWQLLRSSLRDPSVRHISHHKILVELERRFGKLLAVAIGKRVNDIRAFQSIQHK